MSIENSKILIVGGAGFVGSNLTHYLLDNMGVSQIIIIDNLLSSDISNLPDHPHSLFINGSITDYKILQDLPDDLNYVFHLACYHGNQSSIANPFSDHENNALTSLKLFDRIKDFNGIKKVVYAAAGCAVAEKTIKDAKPTLEDAPVSLFHDSPYSVSKLIGEMYGNYYYQRHGLPFVKARFQNVYGPREILGAGSWRGTPHTVWRNVIPTFIWKAFHSKALTLDNNGEGSRDFIYVDDVVRGLVCCAEKGDPGEAYNLASGVETNILELANLINDITGNSTPNILGPPRDWDNSVRRYGSTEKSKNRIDFKAKINIKDGLDRTIQWTKENKSIILESISKHKKIYPEVDLYIK